MIEGSMPHCPRCGSNIRPQARFCGQCGAPLRQVTKASRLSIQVERVPTSIGARLSIAPREKARKQAIFGFRFESLPDWFSAPDVMGHNETEKLAWILCNWQQLIGNLWKWKGAAFALRFLSQPDQGTIDAKLLIRMQVPNGSQQVARALAHDLRSGLEALHLTPQPITDTGMLNTTRRPIPMTCLLEIRQHEKVVQLNLGDAYVVYPLRAPAGDFRLVFEALLRTQEPTLLSFYIEPTHLTPNEQQALAQAASTAQSLSDFQYSGEYYQGRWQDPQATLVGEAYTEFVQRLGQPFLCAAHVAGTDVPSAWTVARALENSLRSEPSAPSGHKPVHQVPVQCDVIQARNPRQLQAAEAAIADLMLSGWGKSLATPGKERLPYLTDAAGAASLMRFPVVKRGNAPGMQVKQVAPGYAQGLKRPRAARDEITIGTFLSGGVAPVKIADLTRHGLIVGFTGSGKTNTCLHLIDQLWRQHHIPVLIIEPAKAEYRGLIERQGFEDVLVFTLGDEATSPFRLNPFELLPGVRVETHISALKTCFNAALPQFGVLPSIVEEAIMRVYEEKDWQLTDRARPEDDRLFPTMRDMYATVIRVSEGRGYSGEVRDNIRAAAAGRIGSLLSGSKGRMFGCQRSIPMETLLKRPTILELDALNDNEKALAMMFLLTHLREYCKINRSSSDLAHVTLIEEAHRVLEDVPSVAGSEVAADTRAEAVRFFSGALAEIRAYGESILIAEQSPSKLAPDAIRNTNLKLAHMLMDGQDRDTISQAMIMDEEQKNYLGKLQVGQAALFMTGYEKATFVQVPLAKGSGYNERLSEQSVESHMQPFRQAHTAAYLPFDGCRFCGSPCRYRRAIEPITRDKALHAGFQEALLTFDERPEPAYDKQNWAEVAHVCAIAAAKAGYGNQVDAAYCYFAHEIDFPFTEYMRDQFVAALKRIRGG